MFRKLLLALVTIGLLTAAAEPCLKRYEVVIDLGNWHHDRKHTKASTTKNRRTDYIRLHSPDHKLTTDERVQALALTLFGEARGEGYEGMMLVGWVIMNRVDIGKAKFKEYHIEQVVFGRKQYSCWNKNDPNLKLLQNIHKLKKTSIGYQRWQQALKISYLLIHRKAGKDPTHGATHYCALKQFRKIKGKRVAVIVKPYWVGDMKQVAVIGNHTFYRAKRGIFARILHALKA